MRESLRVFPRARNLLRGSELVEWVGYSDLS